MNRIEVNRTGYNIRPYDKETFARLEKMTSYLEKNRHQWVPVSGFRNKVDKSFLVYAMNLDYLRNLLPDYEIQFNKPIKFSHIHNIEIDPDFQLKDDQIPIVDRMMACKNPEIFVNIPTATGKTIISSYYMYLVKVGTLIVCPNNNILDQWIRIIKIMGYDEMFKVLGSSKQLELIRKGELDTRSAVYLIKPALITSYGNTYGYDKFADILRRLRIGLKLIDEAHRNIGATVRLNACAYIAKTIYLSADFYKASRYTKEQFFKIFSRATVIRMDDKVLEGLKYINLICYEIDSKPDAIEMASVISNGNYSWSHWAYARYAFNNGAIMRAIHSIVSRVVDEGNKNNDGYYMILILTLMTEHVDLIYDEMVKVYGDKRSISRYHSALKKDEIDEKFTQRDIIISTYQAFSTGIDITVPNIQHVISTSPVDVITHNQSAGRCRPIEGMESYYWMIEDIACEFCRNNETQAKKYVSKVKAIHCVKDDAN